MSVRSWALVTGASSGLGVEFARQLAERGYDLVIVARREEKLRAVAETLRAAGGVRVETIVADLTIDSERARLALHVDALGAPLEVLVNNAGHGLFGRFDEIPWEKERQMLEVDIAAVVHLCKLFVPGMTARKRGYILNVASIGAYQPTPLYASYSAAKSFVRSFSEALNVELHGSGVSATVVSPGVTATEFLDVAKQRATPYQRLVMMKSLDVARAALKATFARRSSVVPGFVNALTALNARLLPSPVAARIAHLLMKSDIPAH